MTVATLLQLIIGAFISMIWLAAATAYLLHTREHDQ